jgi:transcriptional regulator with XRE-family HTH domain
MAVSSELSQLKKRFGGRLQAARVMTGYNDAESFAADVGVQGHTYRKWERGDAWPPLDKLIVIAELTNTTLDFLLRGKK